MIVMPVTPKVQMKAGHIPIKVKAKPIRIAKTKNTTISVKITARKIAKQMAINVTNMKQNPQKKSPALGRSQYQSQILQKGFPIKSAVSPMKFPNFFKIGFNKSFLAILNSTNLPRLLFSIHEQFLWTVLSQLNIFLNDYDSL